MIVTLDDATSAIYSIFLVEEEGTASSFRGLAEVIGQHGLSPATLYRYIPAARTANTSGG